MNYAHKIENHKKVDLSQYDPAEHTGLTEAEAREKTGALGAEMSELQDLLFEAGQTALLIVLQGRDTSGKDGTIRHLLNHVSAQSCRVAPFKVPTTLELSHDFLWRVHTETPACGGMTIFNRSHYEDVLVARVHNLVPEEVWQRRYAHINHFESLLADSDTVILKFYLHISKDEQKRRLLEREKETDKAWKLSLGDWKERELWDSYTKAYEDALAQCGTSTAPWYLVPADHKWFRDLAVTERIVEALRPYKKRWLEHLEKIGAAMKAELEAYRSQHKKGL